MDFGPFLLEQWLEKYEHTTKFNLACSTGPPWAAKELLALPACRRARRSAGTGGLLRLSIAFPLGLRRVRRGLRGSSGDVLGSAPEVRVAALQTV